MSNAPEHTSADSTDPPPRKFKLISCEVFYREMCEVVARSPHQIDIEFLPKGLHDIGCAGMCARLQSAVNAVDPSRYEAILLGYALCNNGIVGLRAPSIPLVVPRGHDCMTLFFGSRDRYLQYFTDHPGTYFLTSGWIERGSDAGELSQISIQHQTGMDRTYEDLVRQYGEDNAKYIYDQLCDQTKHYRRIAFIKMGSEPNDSFRLHAEQRAADHKWEFDQVDGNMSLIRQLLGGNWSTDNFLVVPPGWQIAASYDDGIIATQE
jgi:Protein of unknown function (DUF1638)